jgi:hypothetical protein
MFAAAGKGRRRRTEKRRSWTQRITPIGLLLACLDRNRNRFLADTFGAVAAKVADGQSAQA